MKILAIDTSAHLCAACVFDCVANTILAENTEDIGRGHAERLMLTIAATLAAGKMSYEDLERIAVTCGPGSFTGVRVGLATARGLALGLDIAAVGVNTLEGLEGLALQDGVPGPLATLIDARRGEVYFRITGFDNTEKNQDGAVDSYEVVAHLLAGENLVICGSGAETLNMHLATPQPVNHQRAAVPIETVARMGAEKIVDTTDPQPAYLRPPDAKPQTGFALPLSP